MTTIQLHKFLTENGIEWLSGNDEGVNDIVLFVEFYLLKDFMAMLNYKDTEDMVWVGLLGNSVAIHMRDICEKFDIDMDEVFKQ